jgi:hypothetical protein
MKRFSLIFALLLGFLYVNAQPESTKSNDDINTVFGKGGKAKIGWFIGIDPGFTQFDERDVLLGGLSTGMIINHNFTIGLAGRGWTSSTLPMI